MEPDGDETFEALLALSEEWHQIRESIERYRNHFKALKNSHGRVWHQVKRIHLRKAIYWFKKSSPDWGIDDLADTAEVRNYLSPIKLLVT
jgi:hypothetical protein